MKDSNTQDHKACHSLLQKAVRRGDIHLVAKIVRHLDDAKDMAWLKSRTAIITFEECWPLGEFIPSEINLEGILGTLTLVAKSVKTRDAASLGVLAHALSNGDDTVLIEESGNQEIKQIVRAIKNPDGFWNWAENECRNERQHRLVSSARKAHRNWSWPWDRALIQAGAYLAVQKDMPEIVKAKIYRESVPLWVGLDKHTPQGKKALQEVAKEINIPARQLTWVSFYFESALLNENIDSKWWSKELNWRLGQVGLNQDYAFQIWKNARPRLIERLREDAELLKIHLEEADLNKTVKQQYTVISPQQDSLPGFNAS